MLSSNKKETLDPDIDTDTGVYTVTILYFKFYNCVVYIPFGSSYGERDLYIETKSKHIRLFSY